VLQLDCSWIAAGLPLGIAGVDAAWAWGFSSAGFLAVSLKGCFLKGSFLGDWL
jgi:F0F1-type ATP synthase membrane subunit c/vacuolar-type H+-ATPase subunit K